MSDHVFYFPENAFHRQLVFWKTRFLENGKLPRRFPKNGEVIFRFPEKRAVLVESLDVISRQMVNKYHAVFWKTVR